MRQRLSLSKQELRQKIKPILAKGKTINDLCFLSKTQTLWDVAFMLQILRPEKKSKFFDRKEDNWYGWSTKDIYDFAENPGWGVGDYFEQLVFCCSAALDVYTEKEILTVLETQQEYRTAKP